MFVYQLSVHSKASANQLVWRYSKHTNYDEIPSHGCDRPHLCPMGGRDRHSLYSKRVHCRLDGGQYSRIPKISGNVIDQDAVGSHPLTRCRSRNAL